MIYLLDTNILLHLLRQDDIGKQIMREHKIYDFSNRPLISEVSIGEIKSIALQRQWGEQRSLEIQALLGLFTTMPIGFSDIYDRYAEIDAYSQGKHPTMRLPVTARNMGKNDLWIAATASALGARLLTTDADFDHLNRTFLDLERIVVR